MGKFTHYLVTRFNVRIDGHGPEFIRHDARGTNWEVERIPLFAHYCAPSIGGQTNNAFTWLIYTDVNTPETILQKIINAIPEWIRYLLVPVENFEALLTDLRDKCVHATTPYVVTSRLDNDDGVCKNYIQTIQEHFEPTDNLFINLLGGVNYNLKENILTYHRHSLRNSFCSLVEKRKENQMITVMGFNHLHPPSNSISKNLAIPYAFWMNLHDHNAAIRHNTGIPLLHKEVLRYYAIDPQYVKISISNTISYTVKWFPQALKRKIAYKLRTFVRKSPSTHTKKTAD